MAAAAAATPATLTPAASLAVGRHLHAQVTLRDGRVLVAGGHNPHTASATTYDPRTNSYDPRTNSWTEIKPMTTARSYITGCLLPNGRVFIAGGYSGAAGLATCEEYDPEADTWTKVTPDLPSARFGHATVALPDGRVLVLSGRTDKHNPDVLILDADRRAWMPLAPMPVNRYRFDAVPLPDGRVVAVGGHQSGGRVDVFDVAGNRWDHVLTDAKLNTSVKAVLLPSGKILATGHSGDETLIIDLEAKTCVTGPPWASNHASSPGLSILLDGSVLVVGGSSSPTVAERMLLEPPGVSFDDDDADTAAAIHRDAERRARAARERFPVIADDPAPAPAPRFHLHLSNTIRLAPASSATSSTDVSSWMDVAVLATTADILGASGAAERQERVRAVQADDSPDLWALASISSGCALIGPRAPTMIADAVASVRVGTTESALGDGRTVVLDQLHTTEVRAVPVLVAWVHDLSEERLHAWLESDATSEATREEPSLAVGSLLLASRVGCGSLASCVWRWVRESVGRVDVVWGVLRTSVETGYEPARPLACASLARHLGDDAFGPETLSALPWRVALEVLQCTEGVRASRVSASKLSELVCRCVESVVAEREEAKAKSEGGCGGGGGGGGGGGASSGSSVCSSSSSSSRRRITDPDDVVLAVWSLMRVYETWAPDADSDPELDLEEDDMPPARPVVRVRLGVSDALSLLRVSLGLGLGSSARACERLVVSRFGSLFEGEGGGGAAAGGGGSATPASSIAISPSPRLRSVVKGLPLDAATRILADPDLRTDGAEDRACLFARAWVEENWTGGSVCPLWEEVRLPWVSVELLNDLSMSDEADTILPALLRSSMRVQLVQHPSKGDAGLTEVRALAEAKGLREVLRSLERRRGRPA